MSEHEATAGSDDVTQTLSDLERKLVDLERELQTVASGGVSAPSYGSADATADSAVAVAPRQDPAVRIEDLRDQIADLVRFRDQLEHAAKSLVEEYDRLVERLQGAKPAATAPAPAEQQQAQQQPAQPHHAPIGGGRVQIPSFPPPRAEQAPEAEPEAPAPGEEPTVEGALEIDAGPFAAITTLSAFEQALGRIPGAQDVYVKSFEGDRALIDVRLGEPVAIVQALRETLPLPITLREASQGRLTVDLESDVAGH